MTEDDYLASAFGTWSEERDKLTALKRAYAQYTEGQGQLAASLHIAFLAKSVADQEALCESAFARLIEVAEKRAATMDMAYQRAVDAQLVVQLAMAATTAVARRSPVDPAARLSDASATDITPGWADTMAEPEGGHDSRPSP